MNDRERMDNINAAYAKLTPEDKEFFNIEHRVGPYASCDDLVRDDNDDFLDKRVWPDMLLIRREIVARWGSDSPAIGYLDSFLRDPCEELSALFQNGTEVTETPTYIPIREETPSPYQQQTP